MEIMTTAEYRKKLGLPASQTETMSSEEYQRILSGEAEKVKRNKYGNKKTEVDNILFDSKFESEFYQELKALEKMGLIWDLKLQHVFHILDKFEYQGKKYQGIKYLADFTFMEAENTKLVVVDVKGFCNNIYKLKKKLLLAKFGHAIIFREIKRKG